LSFRKKAKTPDKYWIGSFYLSTAYKIALK